MRENVGKRYAFLAVFSFRTADFSKIDALYECCNSFYKEKGDDARCVTCPKPDLLRYVSMENV